MSTESEQGLRAELNQAELRRRGVKLYELGAVALGVGLFLFVIANHGLLEASLKQTMVLLSAISFLFAAMYNAYARAILLPRVRSLREQLNAFIEEE